MNKIVNELFNRAGGWTEVCDVSGEEILTYNENLDPEKFAELIIKECADIATINQFQYDAVGNYVLKHFGIE
jgi:dephospho-CoA kinase